MKLPLNVLSLIELRGVQASGKTTLAKSMVNDTSHLARINRDDLRTMMFGDAQSTGQEELVKDCEVAIAIVCANRSYSVVVDDTNSVATKPSWGKLASDYGMKHQVTDVETSIDEAVARDAKRSNPVGPAAIRATAHRLDNRKD